MQSEENSFSEPESLPPPPHFRRRVALFSLVIVGLAALLVTGLLYPAARFSLENGPPRDLGRLSEANLTSAGAWVRGTGRPSQEALAFRRTGHPGNFRLTRLEDRPNLWIVLPVPQGAVSPSRGEPLTNETYVPPSTFVGRLVPLDEAGAMFAPIVSMIGESSASEDGFLLVEGDSPRSYRPFLFAALLLAIVGLGCLSFATLLAKRSP